MASFLEQTIRSTVGKGIGAVAGYNRKRLDTGEHPFLTGLHAPMTEELTLDSLKVTGTIPEELDGSYMRIGPNPIAPDPAGHHWFTGDGMVHSIRLRCGKAEGYRNCWIRSKAVAAAGGPSAAPGPRRISDTVNTNVVAIANRPMALVEAGSTPVVLSPSLENQVYSDFDGSLQGSFSAHPHLDPATGEQHAITYDATQPNRVHHVVIDPSGKVVRELAIPVANGPSIHDCALTQRFAVVFDLPVTLSMKALLSGYSFPYRWNTEHPARVGLLPRQGDADSIIWCEVDPCYAFHVANSYDREDGCVVIDLVVYETMFAGGYAGPNGKCLGLERWVVDPLSRSVTRSTIDPSAQEFPRPDERFFARPYRYAWSIALPEIEESAFLGATVIHAHDLVAGTREDRDFGSERYPGEFVFVPRRSDAAEGDGWLMGLVIDAATETTELVILDTRDFTGPPVASVHIPHRVPPGFHGNWIPHAS